MLDTTTTMELKVEIEYALHEVAPSWGNPNPQEPEVELLSVKIGKTEILHELDDLDQDALRDECIDAYTKEREEDEFERAIEAAGF